MKDFEKIVISYFEGSLDNKLKLKLLELLENDEAAKKEFFNLKIIWDTTRENRNITFNTDEDWSRINKRLSPSLNELVERQKIRKIYGLMKYAAILIIALGISYFVFNLSGSKSRNVISTNEVIVEKGQKSKIILSDGTKIWLNSETHLKYPSSFSNSTERNVCIEGEAYFEVAKSDKIPFIVKAGNIDIKVMGTSFNVKNYPGDKTVETTLIEGKVAVQKTEKGKRINQQITLEPNQKAVFNKINNTLIISDLADKKLIAENKIIESKNTETGELAKTEISWKDQVLFFNNESLEEIVVKLERWYGYEIEVSDPELLVQRYKGKFENNETIFQVLNAIKLTTPIIYTIKNKTIVIKMKKS